MTERLFLEPDDERELRDLLRWWRRHAERPQPQFDSALPTPPAVACLLLEDLPSGQSAPVAVLAPQTTNMVQLVSVRGEVTGGTWRLRFPPGHGFSIQATDDIPHDATADELRLALETLPDVDPGDVLVRGGVIRLTEAADGPAVHLGRWFVEFTGRYSRRFDLPRLEPINIALEGMAEMAVASRLPLEDTGRRETAWCLIPVGHPTPLVAGSIALCQWVHQIGYAVWAVECRDFGGVESDDPYAQGPVD